MVFGVLSSYNFGTYLSNWGISNVYLQGAIIFVAFFVIAKLALFISERYIKVLTKKTATAIDDLIIERTDRPLSLIIILAGLRLAINPLGLSSSLDMPIGNTIGSFIVVILTYLFIVVAQIIIEEWGRKWAEKTKSKIDDQLIRIMNKFSKILLSIIGLIIILDLWGVKVGPLVASLGIAGIAVAFALQTTLGNIFGGISLIVDKSIKVDDVIRLDDGTYGEVLDIGIRSTRIRTWDNEVIILPNGKLANEKIKNYTLPDPSIRVTVDFGVEYGSDHKKVKEVVMKEINRLSNLDKSDEPKVMFLEMGDFALKFKGLFKINSYKDRFETKEKITCAIYDALRANKIGIPFPTRTVYNVNQK